MRFSFKSRRETACRVPTSRNCGTWLLFALLAAASFSVESLRLEAGEPLGKAAAFAALGVFVALGARRIFARRVVSTATTTILVVAAALSPLLLEGLRSGSTAPELLLLTAFRNLGLALWVTARDARSERTCALVGAALVMFAAAMGRDALAWGVAALAVALGGAWLAASSWNGDSTDGSQGAARFPWRATSVAVGLVTLIFGLAHWGARRETTALAGFVPGSGGTGAWSSSSRGGVNPDGDAEIGARKDAMSVGFVDSDVFIESQQVSLYDTFSDVYGNPKPPKEKQRKIVVPFKNFIERHEEPAENHRADEQFSVKRTPPSTGEKGISRLADALLYVRGRVPLHLRATAYDRFDGVTWRHAPPTERGHSLEKEDGHWLAWNSSIPAPVWGGEEEHHVKIGTLQTNRVLAAGFMERFRIGRVDRPDFFEWAHDDVLSFTAPRFPPGTTLVTRSRQADPRRLARVVLDRRATPNAFLTSVERQSLSLPQAKHLHPTVEKLALEWTRDVEPGWPQIERVVARLRANYVHDARATLGECEDPVGHFLGVSKRGPDYIFATTTVLMLRSLGYPARLVSGFYARPEDYDAKTGHTVVQSDDIHFWAEVLLDRNSLNDHDRAWITVEPTPGFEPPQPMLTLPERAVAALFAALDWTRARAATIALAGLMIFAWWRGRRVLADVGATLWWRIRWLPLARRRPREFVRATRALLDARSRRAGCPRPGGTTPSRHFAPLLNDETRTWLAVNDWAAFAPESASAPLRPEHIIALGRAVVKEWRRSTLRRALCSSAQPA